MPRSPSRGVLDSPPRLADICRMPALPLLTSRRHVDLLRVASASCAGC
ncbi:putative leader peptide [Streptomyces harbinensis]